MYTRQICTVKANKFVTIFTLSSMLFVAKTTEVPVIRLGLLTFRTLDYSIIRTSYAHAMYF